MTRSRAIALVNITGCGIVESPMPTRRAQSILTCEMVVSAYMKRQYLSFASVTGGAPSNGSGSGGSSFPFPPFTPKACPPEPSFKAPYRA